MATILVLDDSKLVLNATKDSLGDAGHRVLITDEPSVFFALLARERPDLALVDVSMPNLEGDAVVWIARAHQLHACKIVLYSAKAPAELEKLVHSSGADGFICKTPDDAKLQKEVAAYLSGPPETPSGQAPG